MTPTSPPPSPPGFEGPFRTDSAARERFAQASGPVHIVPRAVAVPRDVHDLTVLVSWAAGEGVPLVPRGAGTGMPGGNVGSGVAVDLTGLDTVELDAGRRVVRAGAGATVARVSAAADGAGLYLPPRPSSADRCTVGGMAANNAAGARSFLHGAAAAWIEALDVVLADGAPATLERGAPGPPPFPGLRRELRGALAGPGGDPLQGWPAVRKNSSGYALDRFLPDDGDARGLVVGSEGTLAVVTGVLFRLAERPAARGVALLAVAELDALPGVVARARHLGASACELFGRRLVEMARLPDDPELGPLARNAAALVLVEMEGSEAEVEDGLADLRSLAGDVGPGVRTATDTDTRERLWSLRHRASPLIAEAAGRGLRSTQFIEDSVVPVAALPDYLRGLDAILARAGMDAVVFGHAGDGNVHVNPLVDPSRAGWRATVRDVLEATADLVRDLGGTLSGEHGDGRVRAPLLEHVWGPRFAGAFRTVKRTLDPAGILNPGVIVPLPGQGPLDGLGAGWPPPA